MIRDLDPVDDMWLRDSEEREARRMTPDRVVATGKQFGQKIGKREAKRIASILAPRPWEKKT